MPPSAHAPRSPPDLDLTFGTRVPVRLRAWLDAGGVAAEARVAGEEAAVLDLRTRPPWRGGYSVWSLAAGAPCRSSRADSLRAWMDRIYRVHQDVLRTRGDATREWNAEDGAELRATMRAVTAATRALGVHAAETCDPAARRVALRFSATAREWVYRRILDDATGRVGQLAVAAPGPIVFAAGAAMPPPGDETTPRFPTVAQVMIDGAVAGVRVPALVARAVEAWAQDAEIQGRFLRPEADTTNLFDGFCHLQGDDAEARTCVERQRRFVRHLGRLVAPSSAVLPPPLVVTESDIPEGARDNARWVRAMKAATRLQMPGDPVERDARVAVASFLSKHALAAPPRVRHTAPIRRRVEELIDYVQATGRRPGRSTDPARLFAAAKRWHLEFERADAAQRERERLATPDSPLPPARVAAWSDAEGNHLSPVTSTHQLRRESTEMRHCVESYADQVRAGACDIVSGVVAGGRLTIELRYPHGKPEIAQVRGPKNVAPTHQQRTVLVRWIADVSR